MLRRLRLDVSVVFVLCAIEGCSSSDGDVAPPPTGGGTDGGTVDAPSGGNGQVGAPTSTYALEGDGQTGPVLSQLPIAPRMKVTDADGDPVPGVAVAWSVTEGDGKITGGSTTTGPDGTARVGSWTLGPAPGRNRIVAEIPGLAPVFFTAEATADARGSIVAQAGDFQYARVSTAVSVVPTVLVRDKDGKPVAGRSVTFAVGSGGGSLTGGTATTDAAGLAKVGSWTLGATPGENTLTATTADLPPVTFRATAVDAAAPVLDRVVVLRNLNTPWDLAFLPDETILFTLKSGRVMALDKGATSARELAAPTDVNAAGQSGMLGIAIDPQFATNRFVYTYLSSRRPGGGATDNRIRKWKLAADNSKLEEVGDILTGITWGSDGAHSGGRLRFGPDGFLYATTGDTRSATVPQDLKVMGSKVLRITRDGAPAPGNPSLGAGARPEIFAYGFRNPQGIAFRPGTGEPFICEHGPNQDDEVTMVVSGGNGGWNPNDGAGNYNGYSGAKMTDTAQFPSALRPTFAIADSAGMSGCDFVKGAAWKSWDGSIAVGMLAGSRMVVALPSASGVGTVGAPTSAFGGVAQLRSVTMGPDGALYVLTNRFTTGGAPDDQIWRVTPK